MKRFLLILFVVVSALLSKAQCPTGAAAMHGSYIYQYGEPPVFFDTLCWLQVSHFPVLSKVYFYNHINTLVDSLTTDAAGYGYHPLTPATCLPPPFQTGGLTGYAVSGSCTLNLSHVGLLPIHLRSFSLSSGNNNKPVTSWQLEEETAGVIYTLQESTNGSYYYTIFSTQAVIASTPGKQYQYQVPYAITGKRFYRLKITEPTGSAFYSPVKTASPKGQNILDIYPSIGNGNFTISVTENFVGGHVQVFNTNGATVQSQKINTSAFKLMLNAGAGAYHVRAIAPDGSVLVKTILLQQ